MPGVSITNPPCGTGMISRQVVACRPLESESRTSKVGCNVPPTSRLIRLDLPTPDVPIKTAVNPGPRISRKRPVPLAVFAHTGRTSAPPETASASEIIRRGALHKSNLLRTSTGRTPPSSTMTKKRSSRRALKVESIACTTKATSMLLTTICASVPRPLILRAICERRGKMASMTPLDSPGTGRTATQSPTLGRS